MTRAQRTAPGKTYYGKHKHATTGQQRTYATAQIAITAAAESACDSLAFACTLIAARPQICTYIVMLRPGRRQLEQKKFKFILEIQCVFWALGCRFHSAPS